MATGAGVLSPTWRGRAGALVALAIGACGPGWSGPAAPGNDLERAIIGGSPSAQGAFPAVVVQLTSGEVMGYPMGGMVCTGTLIAPDVVLTAAHCTEVETFVYGGSGSNIANHVSFVLDVSRFGVDNLDLPADAIRIAGMVAHPNWDIARIDTMTPGLQDFYDIAILLLERAATRPPAVVLGADDASGLEVGAEVEIVGYGQRDADDPSLVGVQYHARSFINELGASEMQIGDQPPGDPQKCHGDSGGPTFLDFDDGRQPARRLVGVTSHAYDETDCHKGGVDTLVSAYRAWVDQAMRQACSDGLRVSCAGGGGLTSPTGAAVDAGPVDVSAPDAQGERDAGPGLDLRGPSRDARGTSIPPATLPPDSSDRGCSCRATGTASPPGVGLTLAAAVLLRRRRRRA